MLLVCLDSLAPEVEAGRAQVVVVDNASADGSSPAARARAPWAEVIDAGENLGFGRAVNLVAERTRSEWLVAANADVALEPGALEVLLEAGRPLGVACVAPRLILPDGSTQHSVYPFPTVSLALAFNAGLPRLSATLADRLCLEGHWDPERERDVDWAVGALLLIRRSSFDSVGGFDERQWMYAEDLDLGWRLAHGGQATRYVPRARVRHHSGAATSIAFGDQRTARYMAATYAVIARRRGAARARATAAINLVGTMVRLLWVEPLSRVSPRRRGRRAELRQWLAIHRRALRPPR